VVRGDTYPCEQEIPAGFCHEFVDPDVSAQTLTRFDCLGRSRYEMAGDRLAKRRLVGVGSKTKTVALDI